MCFHDLLVKVNALFLVFYGGRGSGKTISVADYLVFLANVTRVRILCAREFQNSLEESVFSELESSSRKLGIDHNFDRNLTNKVTGSEFLFIGTARNPESVKSIGNIDICWVEEASTVSSRSWEILKPSIRTGTDRKPRFIITFNTRYETDVIYKDLVLEGAAYPPGEVIVHRVNYDSNPEFPEFLCIQMEKEKATNLDKYHYIWRGQPLSLSEDVVFRNMWESRVFDSPSSLFFYHGLDYGFNDPSVVIRCFVKEEEGRTNLYVDYESYVTSTDVVTDSSKLFSPIPTSKSHEIYADHLPLVTTPLNRKGYRIKNATKTPVHIGVDFLKQFDRIIIHPRCTHLIEEMDLYKHKVDPRTLKIHPTEYVDKNNHCIDALRYALSDYFQSRGVDNIWAKLAPKH
jgi:phage terminase large subunit